MFSQSYVGPPLMEETHAVVGRRVSPSIHLGRGCCMKGKEERKMIFEKRNCFLLCSDPTHATYSFQMHMMVKKHSFLCHVCTITNNKKLCIVL
nr:MAG TPA: hypothetical protein [Caudoviricetes sp.]